MNTINSYTHSGGVQSQTSSAVNSKVAVEKNSTVEQGDAIQANKDEVTISQEGLNMLMTDGNEPPATTNTDGNEPPATTNTDGNEPPATTDTDGNEPPAKV